MDGAATGLPTGSSATPICDPGTGRIATRLLAADDQTCALLDSSGIKCWGYNKDGLFGADAAPDARVGDEEDDMGDRLADVFP